MPEIRQASRILGRFSPTSEGFSPVRPASEPATNFFALIGRFAANPAQILGIRHRWCGTSIAALKDKMRFLPRRATRESPEGPLPEVLEAEKSAAAAIAAAKLEAEAWLIAERLSIAKEKDARLSALAARAAHDEEAARKAAVEDAAKLIADADAFSRELAAIGDRELQPLVARHVATIIPELNPEPHPEAQP
jgi:hypothetical protein